MTMEIDALVNRTEHLMMNQYGADIYDYYDMDDLIQSLMDEEEPQALVDEAASANGLQRIQGTLAYDHIESMVVSWRELMVKVLGQEYADGVTDEGIRDWLLKGEEPKPIEEYSAEELLEMLEDI
jgi:hypothetical protein